MTATATAMHLDTNRRHDFVLLFDVQDGNRTATLTPATCRAWTPKPCTAW